jgi:GntR family transcriptional regulator, transcriptional repressor for pyruvate dehydrogenase complex
LRFFVSGLSLTGPFRLSTLTGNKSLDIKDNRVLNGPIIGPTQNRRQMPVAKPEFEAVRKTKVYEQAAQQLQRMIRDGLIQPGDKLPPERELAEMLQVSRGSLRDAIRTLELMGLVEPRQGEGTVVCDPSAKSLINPLATVLLRQRELIGDLLEFRRMIEPTLAGRAAENVSDEELAYMEDILRRQKDKVSRGELAIEEDSEFHYAIAQAAGNSVVLKVLDAFMDLLRETRERSLQLEGRLQKSFVGHRRIFDAIRKHEVRSAEKAMRQHIDEVEGLVLDQM